MLQMCARRPSLFSDRCGAKQKDGHVCANMVHYLACFPRVNNHWRIFCTAFTLDGHARKLEMNRGRWLEGQRRFSMHARRVLLGLLTTASFWG